MTISQKNPKNDQSLTNYLIIAIVTFLILIVIVPYFNSILGSFKPSGPESVPNDHAKLVYENLSQPEINLNLNDIQITKISEIENGNTDYPFFKLSSNLIKILFDLLFVFFIVGNIIFMVLRKFYKPSLPRRLLWSMNLTFWILLGFGTNIYILVSKPLVLWDEIYVMASAAKQFSISGIAGVPVTGPKGLAEASVDLLVVLMAGLVLTIFKSLEADSALLFAAVLLNSIFAFALAITLKNKFYVNPFKSTAVGFIFLLNPVTILTMLGGMPTVVAPFAWAFFGLTFFIAISNRKYILLVIFTIILLFVRWDLGVIAILSCLTIYLFEMNDYLKKNQIRSWNRDKQNLILLIPLAFFIVLNLFKIRVFGSFIPSGLLGKSVGVDSAYLQSGLNYFNETLINSLYLLILFLLIAFTLFHLQSHLIRPYILTLSLLFVPCLIFLPGGKDWFLASWGRYTFQSVVAIAILSIALLGSKTYCKLLPRMMWIFISFLVLVVQIPAAMSVYHFSNPGWYRVECLAKAGKSLKNVFPDVKSLATAEVNTMAFFAEVKLTDLIGIVDPRTALVPKSPLVPGDQFHRRSNFSIILDDQPDAIYLFEGADCSGQTFTAEQDLAKWNELVNSDISRFRAGDLNFILTKYTPVSIVVPNQIQVRFLIKNKHVSKLKESY